MKICLLVWTFLLTVFNENRLAVNESKCNLVNFWRYHKENISVLAYPLKWQKSVKYIGVLVAQKWISAITSNTWLINWTVSADWFISVEHFWRKSSCTSFIDVRLNQQYVMLWLVMVQQQKPTKTRFYWLINAFLGQFFVGNLIIVHLRFYIPKKYTLCFNFVSWKYSKQVFNKLVVALNFFYHTYILTKEILVIGVASKV